MAVATVGVNVMAQAVHRHIVMIEIARAGGRRAAHALQNAQLVGKALALHEHNAADAGGIVGRVRLEAAGGQRRLEATARHHMIIDGVALIAVGDDGVIAQTAHGIIDNQRGILHQRGIERLGAQFVAVGHKDAVAAVLAAPHDEIGDDGAAVLVRADDDAAARIAARGHGRFQIDNVHASLSSAML